MKKLTAGLLMLALILSLLPAGKATAFSGEVALGSGSYSTVLPAGAVDTQANIYKTANVAGAMPTNDWWSNLAWDTYSEAQYPHPLAMKNGSGGIRIYYPGNRITANSSCVCGWINDIHDFTVGHTAVSSFPDAKVDGFSDWFVKAQYKSGANEMNVTYGHGSPYVYFTYAGGSPKVNFYDAPTVWSGSASTPVLGITVAGAHYGLFGASGSTWSGIGGKTLTNNGSSYFSVAVLPDNTQATLNKYAQYAYSHVTGTQVSYAYNASTSKVTSTFAFTTQAKQGTQTGTIFALYPHQWKNSSSPLLSYTYNSVRGLMKTGEGSSFQTVMNFNGVLPSLPDKGSYDRALLQQYVDQAEAETYSGDADTYWVGKTLGKLASLAPIADQIGDTTAANKFRSSIKTILQGWFKSSDAAGNLKSGNVFYYNRNWGTVIGYPASYGSNNELNDHHFHYGYFIKAAAEIARTDKAWAAAWGPMVNLLIRDIASSSRTDTMFPYLRNFDPYAGHSWASGHARFGDGNNNESSSEGMNAWAGMILWGQATGDAAIRDTGISLYTTEMNAINEYWFDVAGSNRPAGFTRSTASMVWGGKTVGDGTWWTGNPEEVHGINWLPFTGASLYLTQYPDYAAKNYNALVSENGGTNFDAWEDLIYMYRAISNPAEAKSFWNARGSALSAEAGNSKAFAYHWIYNLDAIGVQDRTVTANTPLYAVFVKNGVRTYTAYNAGSSAITVTFSDGKTMSVPANGSATEGAGGTTPTPTPTPTPTATPTPTPTPTATPTPTPAPSAGAIPGKIEAESYAAMSGVQTEATTDTGGGLNVGYLDTGDWMDYSVNVAQAGTYTLQARVASPNATGQFQLRSGSTTLATATVPNTGGWQTWTTVSAQVQLAAGPQTLRVYISGPQFNINWLQFASASNVLTYTAADYTATVTKSGTSEALVFAPKTAAAYVDVHYTINGANQQNVRMVQSGTNWTHTIQGVAAGQSIELWFTYEKSGPQYDSAHYTYTH